MDVRFDWQRPARIGLHEAIWGEHKSAEQIVAILQQSAQRQQLALVTRVAEAKAQQVTALLAEQASAESMQPLLHWHAEAGCLTMANCLRLIRGWVR